MDPSAATKMIQGVWDGMSPAYNRFVDERIMGPATNLVVVAVEDYWEDQYPRHEGEPPCTAHGHSPASQAVETYRRDRVPEHVIVWAFVQRRAPLITGTAAAESFPRTTHTVMCHLWQSVFQVLAPQSCMQVVAPNGAKIVDSRRKQHLEARLPVCRSAPCAGSGQRLRVAGDPVGEGSADRPRHVHWCAQPPACHQKEIHQQGPGWSSRVGRCGMQDYALPEL